MSHPRTSLPEIDAGKLARIVAARLPSLEDRRAFVHDRGVGFHTIVRAATKRPLAAQAFLTLCAGLGLDPLTLEPAAGDMPPFRGEVIWPMAGAALQVARHLHGHDQRAVSRAARLSLATVNRAENGQALSAGSLLRLAAYVGLHPHAWSGPPALPQAAQTRNVSRETCSETC